VTRRLAALPGGESSRAGRDRLELLSALIAAPGFDPVFRPDLIEVPPGHPVYGWGCEVAGCERVAHGPGLCTRHDGLWRAASKTGASRAEFLAAAVPSRRTGGAGARACRVCPERPAAYGGAQLCERHRMGWRKHRAGMPAASFGEWLAAQSPIAGYGACQAAVCSCLAATPVGLCPVHLDRYRAAGSPGNVRLPARWAAIFEAKGLRAPVLAGDEVAFRRWCLAAEPIYRDGTVNLTGLQPLVNAEIKWGMHAHAQAPSPARWDCRSLQRLAIVCRAGQVTSLFDLATGSGPARLPGHCDSRVNVIASAIAEGLWCVYYGPDDSRAAGVIETGHFGRRFPATRSRYDLTGVSQRWLRDMLWDHLAGCCGHRAVPGPAAPSTATGGRRSSSAPSLRPMPPKAAMSRTCCGKSMPSGSPPTSVTANGTGCRHGGHPAGREAFGGHRVHLPRRVQLPACPRLPGAGVRPG